MGLYPSPNFPKAVSLDILKDMRTLDDIIPPSRRKETDPLTSSPMSIGNRDILPPPSRTPRFPFATLLGIFIVIAASVGALFYFSSAKVEVTPNSVSAAVQSSFTATKSTGTLPFEIITAQKIASQSAKSTGTKTVNSSASGTITIYNTQTSAQKLITNTRFATTAGLIFRIHAPVTIPGGSEAKPGSINVKVYADQAGSTYNVGPTSFTIPGFAGTPLASKVYAKSSGAMTGGASGTVPVVDANEEAKVRGELAKALAPDLLASIQAQVPQGYILVPGAAVTTYEDLESTPSSTTGSVEIRQQGTVTAVIFPNSALASAIATSVAGMGYQGEALEITSSSNLLLASTGLPSPESTSFNFTLAGTASLVYSVDTSRIAAAVSGKSRSAAEVALTNYPEVKRAVITLRPFWRQSFPQDPASISVVVAPASY